VQSELRPIEDEEGREVYFPHEMVAGLHGFDDLRIGQQVEFTLEDAPYVRAETVKTVDFNTYGVLRGAAGGPSQ
jgi:cold shock CspA family protein